MKTGKAIQGVRKAGEGKAPFHKLAVEIYKS